MTVTRAQAIVVNNTNKPIRGCTIIHKYSDDYVDQNYADDGVTIAPGETSRPLTVLYHTGAFTTSRDWHVSWFSEDLKVYSYTDPENFRGFVDALEVSAPVVAAAAAEVATAGQATPLVIAAVAAAAVATTNTLVTKGATAGFKQHMLRSEDEGKVMEIRLSNDHKAHFHSVSGVSETRVTHTQI
mmetsp:Transcript_320/g.431  ORF Transcript_320/g.431 Transcript_320/m.431 type:complete len:185 (+) Transcript_320:27-581(+)